MASLLCIALLLACFGNIGTVSAASNSYGDVKKAWEKIGESLYKNVPNPTFGTVGGEWLLYGLAESGFPMSKAYIAGYQETVEDALEGGYRGQKGVLHDRKYTEYSRVIIGYTALGLNPTNINGYNMVEMLADFDKVIWQGINGPIFALRALDAGGYEIPKVSGIENVTTREKLVTYLLENQTADGGWTLSGKKADVDLTAMGLESLVPYSDQKEVREAIDKAIACLSKKQNSDGSFSTYGTPNLESCAQVVSALSNVGIDVTTDSRFIKNGKTVLDAMMTFYTEESGRVGFRHVNTSGGGYDPVYDQMATEQGYYALAQYFENVPDETTGLKLTSPKVKTLKATWQSQKMADGYQVTIATNKKFTKAVQEYTVKSSSAATRSKSITGLKSGKTYYVKVQAYKMVNGVKLFGASSTIKKMKVE